MEEELPLLGEDRKAMLRQFLAQGGMPAFAVRAARVKAAWQDLVAKCQAQRDEWLEMVRLRLGQLQALAGSWSALGAWLSEEQQQQLAQLYEELQPELRLPMDRTTSRWVLQQHLAELQESIERFNRRWPEYLAELNLQSINDLRTKYNRYYVFEKECIVGSPTIARQGFEPLKPITLENLQERFPLLPVF